MPVNDCMWPHRVPILITLSLTILIVSLIPGLSWAHVESGISGDGGFISGLTHPVTGLDHVVAMVAVGLWGAILGLPAIWVLPISFPLIMTFGAVLGVMGIPLPGIEVGIAVSAIVLGTVVAMNLRPPLIIAFSIIAFFAIYHGHPHGTALPDFGVPLHYAAGFVVSTGLLHLSGISIGYLYRWKIGERLVRSLGFCISLTGFYFLTAAIGLTT